jgi:hypothetical protein
MLFDHDDARVFLRPRAEQLRRTIGRAVVDDQELEVGEALGQDALNGLAHELFTIEDGHEHGDAWTHEFTPGLPPT